VHDEASSPLLARLPFFEIDLMIIDRIAKEISGYGMDIHVIGRDVGGYVSALHSLSTVTPRVFVLKLC
jgi:hypothetical protein